MACEDDFVFVQDGGMGGCECVIKSTYIWVFKVIQGGNMTINNLKVEMQNQGFVILGSNLTSGCHSPKSTPMAKNTIEAI